MPHRRGLGDKAVDPHAETELGRMLLRGELGDNGTVLELAGATYARLWAGYAATLDGPQSLRNGDGYELHCRGCTTDYERANCLCAMRKRIYLEAATVLCRTAGSGIMELVASVVIHNRQCQFAQLGALLAGLRVLAAHFGLTKQYNSWHQNALSEL